MIVPSHSPVLLQPTRRGYSTRSPVCTFFAVMFAQQGHAPMKDATQEAELRHNVRRLSHHPSLVIFDGCNECTVVTSRPKSSTAVYANFVMKIVGEEDASRAIWPSCPSDGWTAGVHKLTCMANGGPLTTPDPTPQRCTSVAGQAPDPVTGTDSKCIEIHRPKWKGTGDGFPSVNSIGSLAASTRNTPPLCAPFPSQ